MTGGLHPQLPCLDDAPSSNGVIIETAGGRQIDFFTRIFLSALNQRVLTIHANLRFLLESLYSLASHDTTFFNAQREKLSRAGHGDLNITAALLPASAGATC